MRLIQIEITGFRSIPNTITIELNRDVTCLIGANEHGKTNILDALHKLTVEGPFDPHDKNANSNDESDPFVRFTFAMSSTERLGIIKALQSMVIVREDDTPEVQELQMEYAAALAHFRKQHKPRLTIYVDHEGDKFIEAQDEMLWVTPRSTSTAAALWFQSAVPEVLLFKANDELKDSITLPELEARKNLPFEGLLKLAGAWTNRHELFNDTNVSFRLLVDAGRKLTRKVRKVWSQGAAHTFRFHQNAGVLYLTIEDPTTFDSPSRRSQGFRSFFAFYLTLYADTEDIDPEGYILLFDEPGIHLHPQGQKDLLREIRSLGRKNQVVYTTHSPFMIDRNTPTSTLLVYKAHSKRERGTQVNYKPWGNNWDMMNSALGITPADTLFLPEYPLLVEGRSDRLYLTTYMRLCAPRTGADLNFLAIFDTDDRKELPALLSTMLASGRRVSVLADADKGGVDLEKHLRRIAGSRRDQFKFIDLAAIMASDRPLAFEDLLPSDVYLDAVQDYVKSILKNDYQLRHDRILEATRTLTIAAACALDLQNAGIIKAAKDFSKTSVALLYCQQTLDVPEMNAPLSRLCDKISKELGLAE